MSEKILFSLEDCIKCTQTKEIIPKDAKITIMTFPHNYAEWTNDQKKIITTYDVFEDLQKTAPILWVDGEKIIGFLRIKKWIQDHI